MAPRSTIQASAAPSSSRPGPAPAGARGHHEQAEVPHRAPQDGGHGPALVAQHHRRAGVVPQADRQLGRRSAARSGSAAVGQGGQVGDPIGPPVLGSQYSVCSATLAWMSLYSGLWVSGMSDMSLPMLPVTFIFPCMNAAFASSSPLSTCTESS